MRRRTYPVWQGGLLKVKRVEERRAKCEHKSKTSAYERACAAPGGEAHAQRSSRGGGRCEEKMRMVTYAVRVALRGRPLRSGASTRGGGRSTRGGAAFVEAVLASTRGGRLAPIPDQPRRLHDAGQHDQHQHHHDLPPRRSAASHPVHREHRRLVSRPVLIVATVPLTDTLSSTQVDFRAVVEGGGREGRRKRMWGGVSGNARLT